MSISIEREKDLKMHVFLAKTKMRISESYLA
jgi:hypothetical protein